MDINIQDDLNAVNDQLTKLVEELNKVTAAREQLVQQIQNMNGVAMYLRGKLPPEEQDAIVQEEASAEETTETNGSRTLYSFWKRSLTCRISCNSNSYFFSSLFLSLLFSNLTNLFSMKPLSIAHYLDKIWIIDYSDTPEGLTYLGIVDRFNWATGHLSKLSITDLEEISIDLMKAKERKAMIESYDSLKLSKDQQVTQRIALFSLENTIQEEELFPFHSYPINQIGGLHLNIVEFMTDIHPIRNISEAKYYIDRLNLFDEVFEANLEILNEQRKQNIFPPEFVFNHVIRQLNEFLNYPNEENPLFTVFVRKVEELEVDLEDKNNLYKEVQLAIKESVNPAFKSLLLFMEETLPNANKLHGVWSLPDGDKYYALRLRSYTTTDYSAEDIHRIGLSEVARITLRMRQILN